MVLGLTGKIGSGKHTLAKILTQKGFSLLDADKIVHTLYEPQTSLWQKIVAEFGETILQKDQKINRQVLAKIVFNDKVKLEKLNLIIHPLLEADLKKRIQALQMQGQEKILIIAALADEINLKDLVDILILISTPLKERIKRLLQTRNLSEKEIQQRDFLQTETSHFDFKLKNEGTLQGLEEEIQKIIQQKKQADFEC